MRLLLCLVLVTACVNASPRRRFAREAEGEVQEHNRKLHDLKVKQVQREADRVEHERKLHALRTRRDVHGRKKRQAVEPGEDIWPNCFQYTSYCPGGSNASDPSITQFVQENCARTCDTAQGGIEGLCGELYEIAPGDVQVIEHTYENNDNCLWEAEVTPGNEQYVIEAQIISTHIEEEPQCGYDHLTFNDTDGAFLGRLCGRCNGGGVVRSTGHRMFVQFRADISVVGFNNVPSPNGDHIQVELKAVPRQNNTGSLDDIRSYQCIAITSVNDACNSVYSCQNGGTCFAVNDGGFVCMCPIEFSGFYCEMHANDRCAEITCQNNGSCYDYGYEQPMCYCPEYTTGQYCETRLPNPCDNVNCQNGGSCYPYGGYGYGEYAQCYCPVMTTGQFCETRIPSPCDNVVCQNNGSCYWDHSYPGSAMCYCPYLTTGQYCEVLLPDPCRDWTCLNGGSCFSYEPEHAQCSCPPGFIRPHCEPCGANIDVHPNYPAQELEHVADNDQRCYWNYTIVDPFEEDYELRVLVIRSNIESNYQCGFDSLDLVTGSFHERVCGVCEEEYILVNSSSLQVAFISDSSIINDTHNSYNGTNGHHGNGTGNGRPGNRVGNGNGGNQATNRVVGREIGGFRILVEAVRKDDTADEEELALTENSNGRCKRTSRDYGFGSTTMTPITGPEACIYHYCYSGSCVVDENDNPYCVCMYGYTGAQCDSQLPPEPCGGQLETVIEGSAVTLTHNYRDNQHCYWGFTTEEDQTDLVLRATLVSADIERHDYCMFDSLRLSDPMDSLNRVKLCGDCTEGSFQSGRYLNVSFSADGSVLGTSGDNGWFTLTIEAVQADPDADNAIQSFGTCIMAGDSYNHSPSYHYTTTTYAPASCDGEELPLSDYGPETIASERVGSTYLNNVCYTWQANAPSDGQCIVVAVGGEGFRTETGFDFVEFKDLNSNHNASRREGYYPPGDFLFTSETGSIDIYFRTDGSVTYEGFSLDLLVIPCSDRNLYPPVSHPSSSYPSSPYPPEMYETTTMTHPPAQVSHPPVHLDDYWQGIEITHPQNPDEGYGNLDDILWTVSLRNDQPGKMCLVNVIFYETEESFDFLSISDTNGEVARLDGNYTENFPIAAIPCDAAGDVMTLRFTSDFSVRQNGFSLKIVLVDEGGIDLCDPNPCHNGGSCYVRENMMNNWVPGNPTGAVESQCGPFGGQVCCLCHLGPQDVYYHMTKDCQVEVEDVWDGSGYGSGFGFMGTGGPN